ncbi:uncharacterized protein T551_01923 [Pneumocystis jirovecii RU7]|uniref:UEV domain-containing protein n=1 Tax=Pneumocystis jirovecii (strain RU7) TaxID=1408657 RepID=A0A0W4ZNM9_PNEJ7|nr:uncharacterized protein T551_01923 [Pneumocystis jirovecii RU7]KTW29979.1 hypothetical protein T551_01923 [Pneumocystis jirovecii RU7]
MCSYVLNWIKKFVFDKDKNYAFPERAYNDVKDMIDSYPSMDFWIENYEFEKQKQQVLAIKIIFSIIFHDNSYDIPVVLWIPLLYPQKAPAVLIVSEEGTVIRQNNHIDFDGRCNYPYLTLWNEHSSDCNLIRLCIFLRKVFSKDIPIVSSASEHISRSFSSTYPKSSLNDYDLPVKSSKYSFPPPLPDKPSNFLIKSAPLLRTNIPSEFIKKEPVNILDSPDINACAQDLSSLAVNSIQKPLNPINLQLIKQIAFVLQENAKKVQKTIAQSLSQAKSDRRKVLRFQAQIEREKTEFVYFKEQCEKNISILKERIEASEFLIRKYKNIEEYPIDDVVIPKNHLSEQFYELISDQKSIEDAIYVLWKMLESERIDLDTFLKHTRNLAQEQFMKKALIKKINQKLEISQ